MADQRTINNRMLESMLVFGTHMPTGASKAFGGSTAMVTGAPHPNFNAVWVTGDMSANDLPDALGYIADRGHPYSAMMLRGEDDDVIPHLTGIGMTHIYEIPVMECVTPVPRDWPSELERVEGVAALGDHHTLLSKVFKMPFDLVSMVANRALFEDPEVVAVVGRRDRMPVTTALGVRVGEVVGVFNVATDDRYRGRGYGAAATSAVMQPGFDTGASVAVLQSSPSGLSVYESLGFTTVAMHDRWGFRTDYPS